MIVGHIEKNGLKVTPSGCPLTSRPRILHQRKKCGLLGLGLGEPLFPAQLKNVLPQIPLAFDDDGAVPRHFLFPFGFRSRLNPCPSARPGVARGWAAIREGDHPPRQLRGAARQRAGLHGRRLSGGGRPGIRSCRCTTAHVPFPARGAAPRLRAALSCARDRHPMAETPWGSGNRRSTKLERR